MEGFLTLDHSSRTIGYYFPYCSLGIFVADKVIIQADKVMMRDPQAPYQGNSVLYQVIIWKCNLVLDCIPFDDF